MFVSKMIFLAIELLILMFVLSKGYILAILKSIDFPFYDFCWSLVESTFGNAGSMTNHEPPLQVVV